MSAEKQAGGLASDLAAVYGIRNIPMFGMAGPSAPKPATPAIRYPTFPPRGNQDRK